MVPHCRQLATQPQLDTATAWSHWSFPKPHPSLFVIKCISSMKHLRGWTMDIIEGFSPWRLTPSLVSPIAYHPSLIHDAVILRCSDMVFGCGGICPLLVGHYSWEYNDQASQLRMCRLNCLVYPHKSSTCSDAIMDSVAPKFLRVIKVGTDDIPASLPRKIALPEKSKLSRSSESDEAQFLRWPKPYTAWNTSTSSA